VLDGNGISIPVKGTSKTIVTVFVFFSTPVKGIVRAYCKARQQIFNPSEREESW